MSSDAPSLQELITMMPFAAWLGIELDHAGPTEVVGHFSWREDLCTTGGLLHGGVMMAVADSLGGICAFLNLPPGAGTSTISSSTNMMKAVRSGLVTATSRPLRAGRTVIVVQSELRDEKGSILAQTTQAQAVLLPS